MEKKVQEYLTYLSPEFIYIPFDKKENLDLPKNGLVYFNTHLGIKEDNKNIFSPVSGKIIGIKQMIFNDGVKNCLLIENDFMDKREKLNPTLNINKMKKTQIIELLTKYGLNKKINSKTILVVDSFYDKKYDLKDMVINYEFYEEILEAIDEFMQIFNMKNCYIHIDDDDLYSHHAYEKYINAFFNICIVKSNKKIKSDLCVHYTVEEILAIHKAIHQDYMYDNTIITINNEKPLIVKVKLYTSLYELLKVLKISIKNKNVFINKKQIDNIDEFIIDSSIRSIVIKDK
ncbi:MAG: hypothetical protein PUA90_00795 [bacterium]|nr:hypothetical protein [bacterium]